MAALLSRVNAGVCAPGEPSDSARTRSPSTVMSPRDRRSDRHSLGDPFAGHEHRLFFLSPGFLDELGERAEPGAFDRSPPTRMKPRRRAILEHRREGEAGSERANWDAHLLVTTRRLEDEGFSAKKARDLDPEVRHAGGRFYVAEEGLGRIVARPQNRYFREHGLEIAVDPVALYPGPHIGPVRLRIAGSEIVERAEEIRRADKAAARDPGQVLDAVLRHNATFTARDV